MTSLKHGKRVKSLTEPLTGKFGRVVRKRISDQGAWVNMEEEIPEEIASFPRGDNRSNYVICYPEDCEAA